MTSPFDPGRKVPYFILNGKRPEACADMMRWGRWLEKAERHVAQTQIGDVWVSTVFLGLDHNFGFEGPPVLFETMAFLDGESADNLPFSRYCTWEEAEAVQAAAVAICAAVVEVSAEQSDGLMASLRCAFDMGRKP